MIEEPKEEEAKTPAEGEEEGIANRLKPRKPGLKGKKKNKKRKKRPKREFQESLSYVLYKAAKTAFA